MGIPQGSRLSCNAFNGVQDAILKRTQCILIRSIKDRDPSQAYIEIKKMNDILAFADDTLIHCENMHDLRREIEGLSIEIKRMGLEVNPLKCSMLTFG